MENSFSLQFNKMTQLKTVQEYEKEIERLSNENWEIKHQLAHLKSNPILGVDEDIQKLLYDSKTSIDILENENKNFQKQINHMKEILRTNNEEKDKLIKDFNDRIEDAENKFLSIEEENQRLITHIENMKNKYENIYQEHKMCNEKSLNLQNQITNLQNENNNIKNEKATYFSEGGKLLQENERMTIQYKNIYEENLNLKNINNENIKKINQLDEINKEYKNKIISLENINNENQKQINKLSKTIEESEMYFKELQKSFNKETRDKQSLAFENENIKDNLLNANKKIEILENEKRAMKYKLNLTDDHLLEEINNCKNFVDNLIRKMKNLQPKKDTIEFLNILNIKNGNINFVVSAFKIIYNKMKERIEVLRRESHDLTKFNKNDKLLKIIKEFTEEFKKAKNDLDETKEYLEKKNIEIKEIKKERNSIQKMYNSLLQKYNPTTFKKIY